MPVVLRRSVNTVLKAYDLRFNSSSSFGARVRVLENRTGAPLCRSLRKQTEEIIKSREQTMAGYAIVAWTSEGATSAGVHIGNASQIGQVGCPEFVKSALEVYLFARD